jgi:hypothetical protein
MDLNKSINLSFDLKGIDIKNAKLPLAMSVVSILGVIFFGYMSFGVYENYDVHASAKAQYESLVQEKAALQKKRVATLKNNGELIDQLSKSPSSKSELAAMLSGLVAKNGLKISKLTSNDSGPASGAKDTAIELEADGSFPSIKGFLSQAKLIVLASDVIGLKITKAKEASSLHLSLAVKFTQPPKLHVGPQNVAFRMGREDYFFDSFDQWGMHQTGFVQAPDPSTVDSVNSQQASGQSSDVKRNDPFEAPPQPKQLVNKEGIGQDPVNNQVVVKKNNAMYLSGIIYSVSKKFCIIVLPSGESKVLAEGEKINGKYTVNKINDEDVTFTGRKSNPFKVGQELSL